jgi:8-amino-7-oxononanoate synthase
MSERFAWLRERIDELERQEMKRILIPQRTEGAYLVRGRKRLVNFGSNDYLGIASQGFVVPPGNDRNSVGNSGAGSSPLVCGFSPLHQQLCNELAAFEATEDCVLFPSGFAACSGVMMTLPEAGDLILSDELNHASLIDGCRLSKAEKFIYPHLDVKAVRALLQCHRHRFCRAFLVTDAIFSMDGTIAPLVELAELAEYYDVVLIVDEAHSTGVLGETGSGLCEALGVKDRVPVRIGTLSKAIGSQGGFVVGPKVVCEYLIQKCRSLIYSTAASPLTIQAALNGLSIVRSEPQRRVSLAEKIHVFRELLNDSPLALGASNTQIIPVIIGAASSTVTAARNLERLGFFVPAIRPPTVATARLRVSLSALHTTEMLQSLANALHDSLSKQPRF